MSDIDAEIIKILQPDFLRFIKYCIKEEDLNELIKDPACEGIDDTVYFFNLFVQLLLEHKKGVTCLYKKLTTRGYDKKKANSFIYKLLKLKFKNKNKLWSWHELQTYEIDYDPEITTTTTYTID
tara:strand:+ start:657 stop:1028 length:372 start_codon:yes stop_codon:yes gene_type:complete